MDNNLTFILIFFPQSIKLSITSKNQTNHAYQIQQRINPLIAITKYKTRLYMHGRERKKKKVLMIIYSS